MSNDLFNPQWEKPAYKRTYYKATASNGAVALRSSWKDMYNYACIKMETDFWFDNQLTWATFHSTEQLAERNAKSYNRGYEGRAKFECVKLERLSAKEYSRLKRLEKKHRNEYAEKQYEIKLQQLEQQGVSHV